MNISRRFIRLISAAAIVFVLSGCASTRVTQEWKAKDISGAPFQKVMVAAISNQEGQRKTLEDAFVAQLGPQGVASYPYIQSDAKAAKSVVNNALKKAGADAILTVTLLGTSETQNSVQDSPEPTLYPTDTTFYDGYCATWDYAVAPETVYEQDFLIMQVNLYDNQSQKRVWSIKTRTVDQDDLAGESVSYSKMVIQLLRKQGLI